MNTRNALFALTLMVVGVLALSACGGNGSESVEIAILEDIDGVEGEQALEGEMGRPQTAEHRPTIFQDAILEFAACLRDQGLDVPDPDFSGGGAGGGGFFRGNIDLDDPEVQAALEECQDFLPNRLPGND